MGINRELQQATMLRRLVVVCTFLLVCSQITDAQRNRNRNRNANRNQRQAAFRSDGVTRNGSRDRRGTEVYPGCDGKVCLPEAKLCAERRDKVGEVEFGGKSYWFSWNSDESVLRNARWNWFTARNYCRKRCMDLISIESRGEQDFIGREMKRAGVREIWSSGRLCDKEVDGCEQPRFQPYNIRGWFWAATLQGMETLTSSTEESSTDGQAQDLSTRRSPMVCSRLTASVPRPAWPSLTTSSEMV